MKWYIFALSVLSVQCDMFFSVRSLQIVLPKKPPVWKHVTIYRYRIQWWDGAIHTVYKTNRGNLQVQVPKITGLPVIITPLTPNGELLPAAAIFPFDVKENNRLIATWKHGPLASMLFNLISQSFPIYRLNVKRFLDAYDTFDNVWEVDQERIIRGIKDERFYAPVLKSKKLYSVTIDALRKEWIPNNPFYPILSGERQTLLLAKGIHIWFFKEKKLIIQVNDTMYSHSIVP